LQRRLTVRSTQKKEEEEKNTRRQLVYLHLFLLKNHWRISADFNTFTFLFFFSISARQSIASFFHRKTSIFKEEIIYFKLYFLFKYKNRKELTVNFMGNTNSSISVTLDQAQPAICFAGDILSGQVHFNITERTKKINEIYLSLTGDIGYTTIHTMRMQNGLTERTTDYHDVRILGQKFLLSHPMKNEQTTKEMDSNEITILEPGQYKYPFSIRLPEYLPPTLHPEEYPFVRYQIQVSEAKII
jgi:hypothetical protein